MGIFLSEGISVISLYAQQAQGGSQYTSLIFLALLFGAMYFLMIRPQQKRRREYMDLIRAVELGDEIETTGGLFGTIRKLDEEWVFLEIAPGTQVKMNRGAIRRKIVPAQEESEAP